MTSSGYIMPSSGNNMAGPISVAYAATMPRREVIHLYPCYPPEAKTDTLQEVKDTNGVVVKGNALSGSPDLCHIAGLPDSITDAECHGAQLEYWIYCGASLRRDILPRITGVTINDVNNLGVQQMQYKTKLVKRRTDYRLSQQAGLQYRFDYRSKTFASIMSDLSADQLILASPWPVDLEKKVMINPKSNIGVEEPLFEPKEVPQKVRDSLDAIRAETAAWRATRGWGAVPAYPPTLADWLLTHPEFKNYKNSEAGEEDDSEKDAEGSTDSDYEADVQPPPARDLAVPVDPELEIQQELVDAIVAKFTLYPMDRTRYRNGYNAFAAGTKSRKDFKQSVIHQLFVNSDHCMDMHEELMRMHGGEPWQFVNKRTYNNEFWTGGSSLE